jgi:cytidylate kinase
MSFQIAIDGPAGAGKSTIAKMVAEELGFIYVDTGAMYRSAALYFKQNGTDIGNEQAVDQAVKDLKIGLKNEKSVQKVFVNEEDVTGRIRTQEIGDLASATSRYPSVRRKMTEIQKKIAQEQSVVMDGRDIGTQVLPNAQLKIYLTADVACRAKRRLIQLQEKGDFTHSLEEIETEIARRDEQDMNRAIAPLRRAEDAICIDSSAKHKAADTRNVS